MVINYEKLEQMKKDMDMINIKSMLKGKMFLTPKETSGFLTQLGVSIGVRSLYKMIKEGNGIKSVKIAGNRLFPVENIIAYVLSELKQ